MTEYLLVLSPYLLVLSNLFFIIGPHSLFIGIILIINIYSVPIYWYSVTTIFCQVDTAREMLNHVIELKLVSDKERRGVGLEPRPLRVFVTDVLLSRSWLPAPATLTREALLQSVHAYRGKHETLRVMARFLGLSDESPLPEIFWEAYLSAHGHKECFVALLPSPPSSNQPKRETVCVCVCVSVCV